MVDQFLLQALFVFILKAVAFAIFIIFISHDIWEIVQDCYGYWFSNLHFVNRNMQIIAEGFHSRISMIQN